MTIYFDTCALTRLTDDQTHPRISAEADAVVLALERVEAGQAAWLTSQALRIELAANPNDTKRAVILPLLDLASSSIAITSAILSLADLLQNEGFHAFDALHLAVCEAAEIDFLLTVDDRLMRRYARHAHRSRLQVMNPIDWLKRRPRAN